VIHDFQLLLCTLNFHRLGSSKDPRISVCNYRHWQWEARVYS